MGILMYNGGLVGQVGVKNKVTVNGVTGNDLGTAAVNNVLDGITFTSKEGLCIEGAMPNNGAWVTTPTENGNILIPEGYHNGNGYVDTSNVYNAGMSEGAKTLSSGQGILVKNTTSLKTAASSGSTNLGTIYSWTNTYGAGKIYIYAKCTKGSDSYSYTTININGTQVHNSAAGTYIGQGIAIANNGTLTVSCQARAGVGAFMVTFIKD